MNFDSIKGYLTSTRHIKPKLSAWLSRYIIKHFFNFLALWVNWQFCWVFLYSSVCVAGSISLCCMKSLWNSLSSVDTESSWTTQMWHLLPSLFPSVSLFFSHLVISFMPSLSHFFPPTPPSSYLLSSLCRSTTWGVQLTANVDEWKEAPDFVRCNSFWWHKDSLTRDSNNLATPTHRHTLLYLFSNLFITSHADGSGSLVFFKGQKFIVSFY